MTDVPQTYCGNHFIVCVSQVIVLYTLNLPSAISQLYCNRTGRRKKKRNSLARLGCILLCVGRRLFLVYTPSSYIYA